MHRKIEQQNGAQTDYQNLCTVQNPEKKSRCTENTENVNEKIWFPAMTSDLEEILRILYTRKIQTRQIENKDNVTTTPTMNMKTMLRS